MQIFLAGFKISIGYNDIKTLGSDYTYDNIYLSYEGVQDRVT